MNNESPSPRRLALRLAALFTILAVLPFSAAASPALLFGGTDLVTASQNMRGLSAGAVAFSDQTPIHPLTGYLGPQFYGGTFSTGGVLVDTWNVFNDNANGDSLRFRMAAPPLNSSIAALYLWKRDDFASPHNTGTPVDLSTVDATLSFTARRFGTAIGGETRFVVQVSNGSYYVSASQGVVPVSFATVALANPLGATQWQAYSPATDMIGAVVPAPDFTSILAAGVRLEAVKLGSDGGAITVALSEFQVTAGSSLPSITNGLNAFGLVDQVFSHTITATNSPTNFDVGPLPAGLIVNPSTGEISGTPTSTGSFPVSVLPTNASGNGELVTLVISIASPSQAVIPTNGLVANFEFSGTTNDLVANRGGAIFGATLTTDRFGNPDSAYQFDGLSQYIEIPDHDDFSVATTGELTLSVWMRPDALTFPIQQSSGYIHWMGKGAGNRHEWAVRMYGLGNSEGRDNRTSFYLFNAAGGLGVGSYVQDPVQVGEWSHYVAVVDTVADTITWFKDGVQRDQDLFFNSIYVITPTNESEPVRLGTRDLGSFLQGAIDDFRVYNRALSVAEIQQLFGDTLGLNRAPTALSLSNTSLDLATATAGAVVGTLTTVDPDPSETHIYSLPDGGPFVIVADTLTVGTSAIGTGDHTVLVRTTDASGLFFEQTFTIHIAKATPLITWATPATISYGTPLSSIQLNATATGLGGANLTGTFDYTPGAGTWLNAGPNQPLSVSFTPTGADAANYDSAAASTTITVAKASPSALWAPPAAITYGTPLSATQLNATAVGVNNAILTGVFSYSPNAGTILNAGANQSLQVGFTPTGLTAVNYLGGGASNVITVNPMAATITLDALWQTYDGTPRVVIATTTPAGLPVSITYNGDPTAPTNPGSYAVVATIDDANIIGTIEGPLEVGVTALVRHAPNLNGGLDGSIQVLLPESVTLNGNAWIAGDLLMSGTPTLKINGPSMIGGIYDDTGDTAPMNHVVTLNGGAVLRYLVRRVDAIALPIVAAPPAPIGTRNVTLNSAGQSAGDFATLRNLTLNGNAGMRAVPPGTYGNFVANGNSGFTLGTVGATEPSVYHLQNLTLNGNARLDIVGPVTLVLANGVSLNSSAGASDHPEWLTLRIASGGVVLNGNATLHAHVVAPSGAVTINGNAVLIGSVAADSLTINGGGLLRQPEF